MTFGMLLIRVIVGLLFIGHGTQKLFGWFGGAGRDAVGRHFESLGYHPGRLHATLAGAVEAGAGLFLVLGLATPLAAAAVIGVMVNAIVAVHIQRGLWVTSGGIEYPLVLTTVMIGLASVGPGRFSCDQLLGVGYGATAAGAGWGLAALILGLMTGGAMAATRRPAPAQVPATPPAQATPPDRVAPPEGSAISGPARAQAGSRTERRTTGSSGR